MTLESTVCPLCASPEFTKAFAAKDRWSDNANMQGRVFQYVTCAQCGLVYLNPRPRKEDMGAYYGETYVSHAAVGDSTAGSRTVNNQNSFENSVALSSLAREWLYLNRWRSGGGSWKKKLMMSLMKFMVLFRMYPMNIPGRGKRALDIGCGIGDYLKILGESGWKITGLDFSFNAAAKAGELNGVAAAVSDADNLPIKSESLDHVSLQHALEHFYDPNGVIRSVNRVMKKNGVFLIIVPNMESVAAKLEKGYWIGSDAPRHLTMWTPRTINQLLTKNGFTIEWTYTCSSTSSFTAAIEFLLGDFNIKVRRDSVRKSAMLRYIALPIVKLLDILGIGDNLYVIAAKSS